MLKLDKNELKKINGGKCSHRFDLKRIKRIRDKRDDSSQKGK